MIFVKIKPTEHMHRSLLMTYPSLHPPASILKPRLSRLNPQALAIASCTVKQLVVHQCTCAYIQKSCGDCRKTCQVFAVLSLYISNSTVVGLWRLASDMLLQLCSAPQSTLFTLQLYITQQSCSMHMLGDTLVLVCLCSLYAATLLLLLT